MTPPATLYGLRVVTSEHMLEPERIELDAPDRFIEYGPGDESWRRYFGFVVDGPLRPSGSVTRMGNTLYMHPALWERVRKEIGR